MKKTISLVIPVLTLAATLSGCTRHQHNMPDLHPAKTACNDVPYLRKYNCSVDRIEQLAEAGNMDAEYALGYMYYYGIGTDKDSYTAIAWIRAAAGQGQSDAVKAINMVDLHDYPRMGSIAQFHR